MFFLVNKKNTSAASVIIQNWSKAWANSHERGWIQGSSESGIYYHGIFFLHLLPGHESIDL